MYRKLLIYCLCGVLTGALWTFAQDSQEGRFSRRGQRGEMPPAMGIAGDRPDRSDRSNRANRSDRSDRPGRSDRSDRSDRPAWGGPPVPKAEEKAKTEDSGLGLEEIEEEDDTKDPLYGNPYRVIVKRNLFSLKASAELGAAITNVVPLALNTNSLKFMGITTIGGTVKAHFMINKQGQQPPQQYISLSEGQASDGLEVVSINPDPANPTAEVRADDKQIEVSFASHGIKSGASPAPAGGGRGAQNNQQQQGQRNQPPGRPGMPNNNTPQNGMARNNGAPGGGGGFNMPAVNNAQNNQFNNQFNRPMTAEARNFQNRRDGFQGPGPGFGGNMGGMGGNQGGGGDMPPMPPGM